MTDRTCSVEGCNLPARSRGWCSRHYSKWYKYGDPNHVTRRDIPPSVRFWGFVDKTADCWLWTGGVDWDGYGIFSADGRSRRAHRFAYELLVGPIPDGLTIDHLCRVKACVNPTHLEPVTARVNILRSEGVAAVNARRTTCVNGHPLPPDRRCRVCIAVAVRRYQGWSEDRLSAPIGTPNALKAVCPAGHPYDDANTSISKSGSRRCKACHREQERRSRERRRQRDLE